MHKYLRIPHYVLFILIGIAAAIYANRSYDYQVVQVAGATGFANAELFPTPDKIALYPVSTDYRVTTWAYVQPSGGGTDASKPYKLRMPTYSAAGWPLKYYLQYEYQMSPPLTIFSLKNLLLNVLIFACIIALYIGYEWFFGTIVSTTKDQAREDGLDWSI